MSAKSQTRRKKALKVVRGKGQPSPGSNAHVAEGEKKDAAESLVKTKEAQLFKLLESFEVRGLL